MRSELASTNESRSTSRPMNPVSTWSPTARLISACGCASVLSPLMEPEASGAGSGVASSHAGRHGLVGASMFFVFVCPFERENHPLFGWPMTDQSFYVHSYIGESFFLFSHVTIKLSRCSEVQPDPSGVCAGPMSPLLIHSKPGWTTQLRRVHERFSRSTLDSLGRLVYPEFTVFQTVCSYRDLGTSSEVPGLFFYKSRGIIFCR
jgi:hypothetical protein